MTEKLTTHTFQPDKANRNQCVACPYLESNPIHRRVGNHTVTVIQGIARPNKTG